MRFDHHEACRRLAEVRIVRFDHHKACRRLAELWRRFCNCICNCNCNLDTPTRGAREDIQYMHKIILPVEEGGRE